MRWLDIGPERQLQRCNKVRRGGGQVFKTVRRRGASCNAASKVRRREGDSGTMETRIVEGGGI